MKLKCIIFDLDGTIYFGDKLADKASEVIQKAREICHENVFFLTNNSAKTRSEILQKLVSMEINVKLSEIYTSSFAVAKYLSNNNYKRIYCVGTSSLKDEISSLGIDVNSHIPQAVVVGYNKDFSLNDLNFLTNIDLKNCKLIAANKERVYPTDTGLLPGAGPIVSAVEYLLNKKTDIIVGKPNPEIIKIIVKDLTIQPSEICIVGDSFDSDIRMAKDFGAHSVFISKNKITDADIQIEKLSDLLEIIGD